VSFLRLIYRHNFDFLEGVVEVHQGPTPVQIRRALQRTEGSVLAREKQGEPKEIPSL
jgi:hypothetical protein